MPQVIQEEAVYKPVKGDAVDELMAEYMNKMGLHVPLVRLDERAVGEYRRYMFGTKKIQAKILNAKLVIKVGGGFMGIQEFLETYGQTELDKMAALAQKGKGPLLGAGPTAVAALASPDRRGSPTGIGYGAGGAQLGRGSVAGRSSPMGSRASPTGSRRTTSTRGGPV